jgi:hypothetical protein
VLLALATLRTKNLRRTRTTANLILESVEFLRREQREGERIWQAADRLIAELAQLRTVVAGSTGRAG